MLRYLLFDIEAVALGSDEVNVILEKRGFDFSRPIIHTRQHNDNATLFQQQEIPDDVLVLAIRELVSRMHDRLFGAYDSAGYEGEVQALAAAIRALVSEKT
jgi:hypothetical protein